MTRRLTRAGLLALAFALAALVAAQTLRSPADQDAAMTQSADTPSTDLATLGQRLTLPGQPRAARFAEYPAAEGAGDDRLICALVDYGDAAAGLLADAGVTNPDGALLPLAMPGWLAAELGARIAVQPDGTAATDQPVHGIAPFARSPYVQGFALDAGQGRIALCLYTT